MDPTFPLVPIINFLFAFLLLLRLPRRLSSWSAALQIYTVWLILLCTCRGINSTIWRDNVEDIAPVWCDITTRVFAAGAIAIPSSSFAIVRRLYYSTCTGRIAPSQKEKRREILTDIFLTLCFPLLIVALCYIVQGHRYDIYEEIGCAIEFVNTHWWYVIFLMWPIVFGLMSVVYAALIVRAFITQHKELNEVLTNTTSRINYVCFYRAFALTSVDTLFTIPLAIFIIYYDAVVIGPVVPWPGWTEVHYNFSRVEGYPAFLWRDSAFYSQLPVSVGWAKFIIAWNQWIYVFCASVFTAIYGTTGEVLQYYTGPLKKFASLVGLGSRHRVNAGKNEPSTLVFQSVAPATERGTAIVTWQDSSVMPGMSYSTCTETSIGIHDDLPHEGENEKSSSPIKIMSSSVV